MGSLRQSWRCPWQNNKQFCWDGSIVFWIKVMTVPTSKEPLRSGGGELSLDSTQGNTITLICRWLIPITTYKGTLTKYNWINPMMSIVVMRTLDRSILFFVHTFHFCSWLCCGVILLNSVRRENKWEDEYFPWTVIRMRNAKFWVKHYFSLTMILLVVDPLCVFNLSHYHVESMNAYCNISASSQHIWIVYSLLDNNKMWDAPRQYIAVEKCHFKESKYIYQENDII